MPSAASAGPVASVGRGASGSPGRAIVTLDVAVILATIALSSATYVFRLGNASDSWAFAEMLQTAPDQSFAGLSQHFQC